MLIPSDEEQKLTSSNRILPAKSNVELPFWLAYGFMEMQMVKVQLPKYYHPEFISVFSADSEIANLRDKSYYYYELVRHISSSFSRTREKKG